MVAALRKRWFVWCLLAAVVVAAVAPDVVDAVVRVFPPRWVVATTLFCMAWTLESHRLWRAFVQPAPALLAVVISYGFVPLLGWAVSFLLPTEFRIGLLVATSVPCTLASATIWTRLAGGNEATALMVTMATTCTSWLVTTSWLSLTTATQVEIDAAAMMRDLVLYLVLPVAIGQSARWPALLRHIADRGRTLLSVVSRLLILIIILQAVVLATRGLAQTTTIGWQLVGLLPIAGVAVSTHLAALGTGYWISGWLGFDTSNRIAVAFASSQKTLPVGLLLVHTYYREFPLAIVPMVFFHVGQLLVDTLIAERFRQHRADLPGKRTSSETVADSAADSLMQP